MAGARAAKGFAGSLRHRIGHRQKASSILRSDENQQQAQRGIR